MSVNQTEAVLMLLRTRGERGLTPLDALQIVGSFRLGARIYDAKRLLEDGEEIITERVTTNNGAVIAKYVLRKPNDRN